VLSVASPAVVGDQPLRADGAVPEGDQRLPAEPAAGR